MPNEHMKDLMARKRAAKTGTATKTVPTPGPTVIPPKQAARPVALGAQARTVASTSAPSAAPKRTLKPQAKVASPTSTPVSGAVDDHEDDEFEDTVTDSTVQAEVRAITQAPRGGAIALPINRARAIDERDVIMPRLALSHGQSKVVTSGILPAGIWYHSTSNANLGDSIYVIVTDMRKTMSYYVNGEGLKCRSFDLIKGEGDPGVMCFGTQEEIDEGIPESQRGCALRLWGERDSAGRSERPDCQMSYNFPLLIMDPEDPYNGTARQALLTLRGTATTAGKQIISTVTESGNMWHELVFQLSVGQKTGPRGTYYVPLVEFAGEAEGKAGKLAAVLASRVAGNDLRSSMERSDVD